MVSSRAVLLSVRSRTQTGGLGEGASERRRVAVADLGSEVVDGVGGGFEQPLGRLDTNPLQIAAGRLAGGGLEATGERAGADAGMRGQLAYRDACRQVRVHVGLHLVDEL